MKPIRYTMKNRYDTPVDYWPTLAGFLDFVEPGKARKTYPNGVQWKMDYSREELRWSGGLRYDDAWNMCRQGMTVQTPDFLLRDELVRRIRPAPTEQPTWDVTGGAVDIGNYLSGIPECMLDYERVDGRSPTTIALMMQVNARSDAEPEQLRLRGVAYMALLDALELSRRYRVAVYAVVALAGWQSCICLKPCGHPYDPHALGFVLGHPSFLRRLHFCAQDMVVASEPYLHATIGGDRYGAPTGAYGLPPEVDTNVIDVGERLAGNPLRTEQDAVRWVTRQLETFNTLDKEGIA